MATSNWRLFTIGSMIGWAASALVVATDSVDMFSIPAWQPVLFYPGVLAGTTFYSCCRNWFSAAWEYNAAVGVGVLVVGLSYGVVALGVGAVVTRFSNRAAGQDHSTSV